MNVQVRKSLIALIAIFPIVVYAAALDIEMDALYDKVKTNPKYYDRYDALCKNKSVSEICSIPGSLFEGGGNGYCEQHINKELMKIDLRCKRSGWVNSLSEIPDYPWRLDDDDCTNSLQGYIAQEKSNGRDISAKLVCDPTPLAIDSYCKDKSEGDSCEAKLDYHSIDQNNKIIKGIQYPSGICKLHQVNQDIFEGLRVNVIRNTLECKPQNPTNIKDVMVYEK